MTTRQAHVVLEIDTSRFVEQMARAAEAMTRLELAFHPATVAAALARASFCRSYEDHLYRHHMPEAPSASAMHAAYDRRRRARRRRNR